MKYIAISLLLGLMVFWYSGCSSSKPVQPISQQQAIALADMELSQYCADNGLSPSQFTRISIYRTPNRPPTSVPGWDVVYRSDKRLGLSFAVFINDRLGVEEKWAWKTATENRWQPKSTNHKPVGKSKQ